ncbi:MAG: iron ABC transporter ATP-binding protein [Caldibacillus debilis]|jgi:iron complex transport system ATP-binding protein|uniref:ABC-type cobalamin/Fe3+-siderophore transport system, ATPase component n=2 Tax=Caldibacillus debilis TaxID=301148 RepID=A0A420VBS1_9BACI|nr:ABC transporter ATP-binding protein [Caldibacillus debilis]REJ20366.1 MAG: iron ABC transporter ATP-binding protein [Caldibacillus debilis]REJ23751.1 MAG: iron ABC transporter ATP-binding protein [Caldibacillus debilis]RKO61051.1 ABC-type cobalamin/Fe3+-siderophore transport system, ATPase component [Caldibacillus debilis GB1]
MEVNNVSFSYDQKADHLKSVDLAIAPGKITSIIGPNGCGKSTLLEVMSGLHAPQKGRVILDGKLIRQYKPKELAKRLAVVHQKNEIPFDINVENLVGYGRMPYQRFFQHHPSEEDEKVIDWALSITNLQSKRKAKIEELSGGERQRVWIAMALAQKTPMLFLDEPTTYLDVYYQFEILELIKKLNREHKMTIVMVLHDMNQAIRYSDRIIVMKDGAIVAEGSPEEVITESMIEDIYGVKAKVKYDDQNGFYVVPIGVAGRNGHGAE